jgi:hypothetical protein
MKDADLSGEQPLLAAPPSLLKLTALELTADEAAASSRAAGLAKLLCVFNLIFIACECLDNELDQRNHYWCTRKRVSGKERTIFLEINLSNTHDLTGCSTAMT